MGNTHVKPHPRTRNKKQVHWKAAARPQPPGKPHLISEAEITPDLVTIRWTKPNGDGGSPISGYLVEHRRQGSPHWVRATPLMVQNPELTISGLEPGWRYQFRVSAQNAVGISDPSELSELITVTLQRSAITAPRFSQELQEMTALENERAEFVVQFLGQPAPKICWFKDAFEIFSSRRIRILTESDRSVLTIHQCSLTDEGEIKCTATNRAGHVSCKAKLTVEAPPSIRLPRQYADGLLFEIGELIRLKVSVAGRPTPLVFWSHNGEFIKNNDRYETEYIDKCSSLKINEARRDDRGEYQIKAVNKLGEDIQSFLVTVTDKPSPPGKARVVMALGRSVTLSWTSPKDDGGSKIGNYIVEYYRLGWNVWLKAATSRQLTTMLGDLIEGSEYKFRVKAESPYGVSDPSDETEVVFIPDQKRGILQPPSRERGQSKQETTPVAARRRNKSRSQSSSRSEDTSSRDSDIPVRPERAKIKSPPKTPDMSPTVNRKDMETRMNKEIFERSDRSSMTRDMEYGSPEIIVKRDLLSQTNQTNNISSNSDKSRTPSPLVSENNKKQPPMQISPSDSQKVDRISSPNQSRIRRHSASPERLTKLPRDNNENFTGSSEFMLVLYPGENEKGQFEQYENSVPPPMSLSAPELGTEEPSFGYLRNSSSSTELLRERAISRLYEDVQAEHKTQNHHEESIDIPKIQINSKDIENKISVRRRISIGGISNQQALWAQRRHSLRNPSELKDELIQPKLTKFPTTAIGKREAFMNRQRSESEEKEEQEFEEIRRRSNLQNQSSIEKRKIHIVDEEKWADDYVSSTEEESESSSAEETPNNILRRPSNDSEDEETYHPKLMLPKKPFEILTKRKNPPSPDFVPKPILKKKEQEEKIHIERLSPDCSPNGTLETSHSPTRKNMFNRSRSHSLADATAALKSIKKSLLPEKVIKSRSRSSSLVPPDEIESKLNDLLEKKSMKEIPRQSPIMGTISAVAQITGITAASIVIPDKLLEKQKDAEEAKVVIDHYGDIVKNYGRRRSNPQVYVDKESLKRITHESDLSKEKLNEPIVSKYNNEISTPEFQSTFFNQDPIRNSTNHYDIPKKNSHITIQDNSSSHISRDTYNTYSISNKTSATPQSRPRPSLTLSPVRVEEWNPPAERSRVSRRVSPSPKRKEIIQPTKRIPSPLRREPDSLQLRSGYRPMLREIMTQTSQGLESFDSGNSSISNPSEKYQQELNAMAEVKVRTLIDYVTDLAMFFVACWLYLFKNELLAIPVLLVMVYRQLQDEIARRIPKWLLRRFKRENE